MAHAARRVIATSAAEALTKAQELAAQEPMVFRGQLVAAPVRAALHRLDATGRDVATARFKAFREWLRAAPTPPALRDDPTAPIIAAQHHHMPTPLISVTTAPEIAAYFALEGAGGEPEGPGVIYGWSRAALEADDQVELLAPPDIGLWRLESQGGLFVFLADPDLRLDQREGAVEIVFPHGGPAPEVARERAYPTESSPLEVLVERYLADAARHDPDAAPGGIGVDPTAAGRPYPAALFGRTPPPPRAGWRDAPGGWTAPARPRPGDLRDETIAISEALDAAETVRDLTQPEAVEHLYQALTTWIGRRAPRYRGGGLRPRWLLDVEAVPLDGRHALEAGLDHFSDRLALAPIDSQRWSAAHAGALTLAIGAQGDPDRAAESFAAMFGPPIALEIESVGGAARPALAAQRALAAAFDPELLDSLTPYHRRKTAEDPTHLAALLGRPAQMLGFEAFVDLYFREIAPSEAVLEALTLGAQPIEAAIAVRSPLNPALVERIGLLDGGLGAHIADPHSDEAIYLFGDMTPEEATFEARSALAARLIAEESGRPAPQLFVRFFNLDAGAGDVWDSADAVALARALIEHGALAAMQPSTTLPLDDAPPRPRKDLSGAGGWGGLEIFAVATGEIARLYGDDAAGREAVLANYEKVLAQSQHVAETYWVQITDRAGAA